VSAVADRSPEAAAPRGPGSLAALDMLKGLAILAVLWQHSVPADITNPALGNLWIRPAVPIFLIILGYNTAGSLRRRGVVRLDGAFWSDYARRRVARVILPFLPVLAAGYVIAAAQGQLHVLDSLFIGGLPINAPGNYYIPALIAFTIVLPAIVEAMRRWPMATLLGSLAINALFEIAVQASTRIGDAFPPSSLLYQANPLRWLFLVVLGVWVASDDRLRSPHNRLLVALAIPSALYLVLLTLFPGWFDGFISPGFLGYTNLLAAPWALLLFLLGLRYLGRGPRRSWAGAGLVELGRASYHVFLVQMLWMGWVVSELWSGLAGHIWQLFAVAPINMLASALLGYAYFRVFPGDALSVPAGRRRRAAESA
jgi:peptidoglycan/LPS O-acetylase OafA/YrhL